MDILAKPIHSGFVLTPTIIAGGITGYTLAGGGKTLTVPLDASVSGTNTGDNANNTSVASKALDNLASVAMNAPLQWNNSAATSLDIASTANTVVGRALTISAGSTVTGGTADMAGGNLTLNSGLGKGTGASSIIFQTGRTLTTGSTLQTLTTAMTILGSGNVGIGTTGPGQRLTITGYGADSTSAALGIYNTNVGNGAVSQIYVQNDASKYTQQLVWGSGNTGTRYGLTKANLGEITSSGDNFAIGTIGATPLSFITNSAVGMTILSGGNVGIGTTGPTISGTGKLDMNADTFRLRTARTPASASAAGNAGEICWGANYIYCCVATNTWVRTPMLTWV